MPLFLDSEFRLLGEAKELLLNPTLRRKLDLRIKISSVKSRYAGKRPIFATFYAERERMQEYERRERQAKRMRMKEAAARERRKKEDEMVKADWKRLIQKKCEEHWTRYDKLQDALDEEEKKRKDELTDQHQSGIILSSILM